MRKSLFFGNWKMNMLPAEALRFAGDFLSRFTANAEYADCGFAAPYTTLAANCQLFSEVAGVRLGAQNVHWLSSGAHTGEISLPMLTAFAVDFVLCGHSERRQLYGETSEQVSLRAKATIDAGLTAVVCIGESAEDFRAGRTTDVVAAMLTESLCSITTADPKRLVLAYEPVWAIGTGLAATPEIAETVHQQIRALLENRFSSQIAAVTTILYGGSAKPDNIQELISQPNVDGALVGGVSLDAAQFSELVRLGRAAASAK